MSDTVGRIVVLGAGQAGAWAARTLRSEGFAGTVTLLGDEPHPPYERPPLSKDLLAGKMLSEQAGLLSIETAAELGIDLKLGWCATSINPQARTVVGQDGEQIPYDRLIITTGASARQAPSVLSAKSAGRIHVLRTLDDAQRLNAAMAQCRSIAIVGGGWIGLEVAATARALGLDVVLFQSSDRLCARSLPAGPAEFLLDLHKAMGVDVRLGTAPDDLVVNDHGQVEFCVAGQMISAEIVVLGIGASPNDRLAGAAGLAVDNGIIVDAGCRTSDPFIFAAGDVTRQPDWLIPGATMRMESWANAQNQGVAAARSVLGDSSPFREVPWLWSDQYDCNIQIVGSPERAVHTEFDGDLAERRGCWTALGTDGKIVGAVAVNAPRDLRKVRKALNDRLQAAAPSA